MIPVDTVGTCGIVLTGLTALTAAIGAVEALRFIVRRIKLVGTYQANGWI